MGWGAPRCRRHPTPGAHPAAVSDDRDVAQLGGNKYEIEGDNPHSQAYGDYNNFFYARHGFAVVNYTARGEGNSCGDGGMPDSQHQTGPCARGCTRIGDQRFEARDTQYLLGLLVDEGVSDPRSLGVTGWSYGGGRTFELAYLRNRIRCAGAYDTFAHDPCRGSPDGALIPWRSPRGTPLSIAAAWPRFGYSDLAYALVPNGRFLDYDPATDGRDGSLHSHSPVGIPVLSVATFLYRYGEPTGYYERATGPAAWNLTRDYGRLVHGSALAIRSVVDQWRALHSGFGIPGTPAPLLIEQGWTDDFFPPEEALRVYNDIRTHHPRAFVALQLGDWGHPRASSKPGLAMPWTSGDWRSSRPGSSTDGTSGRLAAPYGLDANMSVVWASCGARRRPVPRAKLVCPPSGHRNSALTRATTGPRGIR